MLSNFSQGNGTKNLKFHVFFVKACFWQMFKLYSLRASFLNERKSGWMGNGKASSSFFKSGSFLLDGTYTQTLVKQMYQLSLQNRKAVISRFLFPGILVHTTYRQLATKNLIHCHLELPRFFVLLSLTDTSFIMSHTQEAE